MPAEPSDQKPSRLFGVLVTYRRPGDLERHLRALRKQTQRLERLVVVDNAPDATNEALVRSYADYAPAHYLPSSENSGAAGGIAQGLRATLAVAGDADWVVLLDDDNPPRVDDLLEWLLGFARDHESDHALGAVGLTGSRFDRRRGRLQRLRDDELVGVIDVDFIGGNQFPLLRIGAVRDVGVFREELFWGFEELDYGLRLRASGYRMLVSGELARRARELHGRLGWQPSSVSVPINPWRHYYTLRNLIDILRRNGQTGAALRVAATRGVGKATLDAIRHPRNQELTMRLTMRAFHDGWCGRLGRTIEPG